MLSETNNMYRTLCALFVLLPGVVLFDRFAPALPWLMYGSPFIVGAILLVLFSYAYRKQTGYIARRVNKAVEDANTGSRRDDAE